MLVGQGHEVSRFWRSEREDKASHHARKNHSQAICTTEAESKGLHHGRCTSLARIGRRATEACVDTRASGRAVRSGSGCCGSHAAYRGGVDSDWVLGTTRIV